MTTLVLFVTPRSARFIVIEGKQVGAVFEVVFDRNRSRVRIGTASDNDIVLDEPFASLHHADIFFQQEHCSIHDNGSTNGVWLNGQRQPADATAALANGDLIGLGRTTLRFELDELRQ